MLIIPLTGLSAAQCKCAGSCHLTGCWLRVYQEHNLIFVENWYNNSCSTSLNVYRNIYTCQLHNQRQTMGKNQQTTYWNMFSDLFQKTGFDVSWKLTVCIKCQTLFSEEKKSLNCCLSVEFVLSVVTVKLVTFSIYLEQGLYKPINVNHCWNQLASDMALFSYKLFRGS